MAQNEITVNSRKYDQSIRRTWTCDLVSQSDTFLTLVGIFDAGLSHPELGHLQKGTISYEYYWLDRWYNIFCFLEPDGRFRNYYCNINMPPTFAGGVLDYVDLDIDVVVWPEWNFEVLDREEFEMNSALFAYPATIHDQVARSLADLIEAIEGGGFPQVLTGCSVPIGPVADVPSLR